MNNAPRTPNLYHQGAIGCLRFDSQFPVEVQHAYSTSRAAGAAPLHVDVQYIVDCVLKLEFQTINFQLQFSTFNGFVSRCAV
jgi:hypothetical protein